MIDYAEVFARCDDFTQLRREYIRLCKECAELSDIKKIDLAYNEEWKRRKNHDGQ